MTNTLETVAGATVVIAGASSGFGRGTALELARRGASVVLAARRTRVLDELEQEITLQGGQAIAVKCDVSSPGEVEHLCKKAVEQFGQIDVWINNVGVGALGYFWDIPTDVHARVVDVNLNGLIYGCHAALRQFMKQDGGTLINVGSVDSEVPLALQNTYAATKAAVLSLSRSLNEELRLAEKGDRIRVATIMPWAVDTPWWIHAANYTGHAPRMAAMDEPELVVAAIVEACTDPKEEMPVGYKAHASAVSHHIFPDLTERVSANLAASERDKAIEVPITNGSVFEPMEQGTTVEGQIRHRMKAEDSAR